MSVLRQSRYAGSATQSADRSPPTRLNSPRLPVTTTKPPVARMSGNEYIVAADRVALPFRPHANVGVLRCGVDIGRQDGRAGGHSFHLPPAPHPRRCASRPLQQAGEVLSL